MFFFLNEESTKSQHPIFRRVKTKANTIDRVDLMILTPVPRSSKRGGSATSLKHRKQNEAMPVVPPGRNQNKKNKTYT